MVKFVLIIRALVAVAFFTLLERKVLGYRQSRKGASKPSVGGLLVPFADALKLFFKQRTMVSVSSALYWISAGLVVGIPILLWSWRPMLNRSCWSTYLVIVILALFGAQVFGRFGAG